ncbi:hypothetical protein ACGF0J_08400 [Nonomuraea sp. NPDC047897]|uniref:hypothetical protein n=1 Tax=Nonomuraea sp. NPDC047897 TaxID=3364346 RepID=UPI0037204844
MARRKRWPPSAILVASQAEIPITAEWGDGMVAGKGTRPPRPLVFLARHLPAFKKLPSKLIAYGPRPEHAPDFARRTA